MIRVELLFCRPFYTRFSFELLLPQTYFHDLFSSGGNPIFFFTYNEHYSYKYTHNIAPMSLFKNSTQNKTKKQAKEENQNNNKIPT